MSTADAAPLACDVFTSYSHEDTALAERLSRRIRRYRLPRALHTERRRLVVFRDVEQREDQAGFTRLASLRVLQLGDREPRRVALLDDGITVRLMLGRTALGRRLAMVAGVDLLVTISGKQHTEVVVEQALELGVPVLPIPDAGGDSEDLLHKYRDRSAASVRPGALDGCLAKIAATIQTEPKSAARAVVDLFGSAKVGKCLVLLPYDDDHNQRYVDHIRPAIEEHMLALRLDNLPKSDAIYTSFADAIQTSAAVIADITTVNQNAMYEVGYAHGRGLTPLLFTLEKLRPDQLPVYFRTLNVRETSVDTLRTLIDEYLRDVKRTRKA